MKRHRFAIAMLTTALLTGQAMVASAQPSAPVAVDTSTDELPPISPKTSPGPMSLDACIDLGFQHQPALAAANASLNAAYSGKRAIDKLIIPRLFRKDLPQRREQACYGVEIAGAALTQAEWETRYAITRNFFTVQYIRSQQDVIANVLDSLQNGYKRAEAIYKAADTESKITKIDLDMIRIQINIVNGKKSQAKNGMDKALAALREAMGLDYDYPLEIAAVPLPAAVYEVKKIVFEIEDVRVEVKDKDGKVLKDKDGKTKYEMVKKKVGRPVSEFFPLYKFNKHELIKAALANRPEMTQAVAARMVVELEAEAQSKIRGYQGGTFGQGSDPHSQPIPQGRRNGDYEPGAFSIEIPAVLAGRKKDRIQRAQDLADRARAVVDKAHNLISLDVEAQYLKWQEAVEDIEGLREIYDLAQRLPDLVQKIAGKDLTGPAIIQANVTAVMVRTSLNEQMHNHALALAGLERATAGTFRVYPIPTPKK